VVPGERIELPTNGLQNRCSTAELNRLTWQFNNASRKLFTGWQRAGLQVRRCFINPAGLRQMESRCGSMAFEQRRARDVFACFVCPAIALVAAAMLNQD
jgi:hypothetical protein